MAYVGELHPQVLLNWSLDMPVAVLELNISDLLRIMKFPTDIHLEHKGTADSYDAKKQQTNNTEHKSHKSNTLQHTVSHTIKNVSTKKSSTKSSSNSSKKNHTVNKASKNKKAAKSKRKK